MMMIDRIKPYSSWAGVGVMLLVMFYNSASEHGKSAELHTQMEQRIVALEQAQKDAPARRELDDVKLRLQRIEDKLDKALDGRFR